MATIVSTPNLYAPTGLSEPNPSWFILSGTGNIDVEVLDASSNLIASFRLVPISGQAKIDVSSIAKTLCTPFDIQQVIYAGGFYIDTDKRFATYRFRIKNQTAFVERNLIWAGVSWNEASGNSNHERYVIFETDLSDAVLVDFEEVDYSFVDFN